MSMFRVKWMSTNGCVPKEVDGQEVGFVTILVALTSKRRAKVPQERLVCRLVA